MNIFWEAIFSIYYKIILRYLKHEKKQLNCLDSLSMHRTHEAKRTYGTLKIEGCYGIVSGQMFWIKKMKKEVKKSVVAWTMTVSSCEKWRR